MCLVKRWSWARCARDESGQLRGVIDLARRSFDGTLIANGERTDGCRQEKRARIARGGEESGSVSVPAGVPDRAVGVVGGWLLLRRGGLFTVAARIGVDVRELAAANQEDRDGPDELKMAAKDKH